MTMFFHFLGTAIPVVGYCYCIALMLGFLRETDGTRYGDSRWYHYPFAFVWPMVLCSMLFATIVGWFLMYFSWGFQLGVDFGKWLKNKQKAKERALTAAWQKAQDGR